ncbi:BlaI/MecI/CopY family transcriptional regulator [Dubosiella newyorkensis]|jgi:predicted transcriptional regulator|uniref:BlaI/MecI/CopY family transcriptional regulator n=1 Tax=Dubosiella newyorkensis TaxID=1862672 RepID=UPI0023558AEB|nr:BlaI/MecI/CopY family transcriptional regulator [Dubosiella newyorkensis]MCI9041006.1 BlaI/MecI/CopY family transcriptional regulator [Dubosiella newyorkensis]
MKILTGREFEVMKVIWDANKSLSVGEIQNKLPDLSIYSVQQVLRKLLKDGFVYIEKSKIQVKALTRFFAPIIKESDYVHSFISPQSSFEIASWLIQETQDKEAIQRIETLIREKKKEWESLDE